MQLCETTLEFLSVHPLICTTYLQRSWCKYSTHKKQTRWIAVTSFLLKCGELAYSLATGWPAVEGSEDYQHTFNLSCVLIGGRSISTLSFSRTLTWRHNPYKSSIIAQKFVSTKEVGSREIYEYILHILQWRYTTDCWDRTSSTAWHNTFKTQIAAIVYISKDFPLRNTMNLSQQ